MEDLLRKLRQAQDERSMPKAANSSSYNGEFQKKSAADKMKELEKHFSENEREIENQIRESNKRFEKGSLSDEDLEYLRQRFGRGGKK